MGNRFREQPGYFSIIRAHGIIAAITFLLIVPSSILTIRFHRRTGRMGVRIHIWLQISAVLLATVVFILGWFAVGPSRKLSNPHHGIGLAIYVLILAQAMGGWWVHRRQRRKKAVYEPLKAMVLLCCAPNPGYLAESSSFITGLVARLHFLDSLKYP